MLQSATDGHFWAGLPLELNITFDMLKDFQWDRVTKALWSYARLSGPFEERYQPNASAPAAEAIRKPAPTDTITQFGALQINPEVRVGVKVMMTRSLFECISIIIPSGMFANYDPALNSPSRLVVEEVLRDMALNVFDTTGFLMAIVGADRGCVLVGELLADSALKERFIQQGNFLATDEVMDTLKVDPRRYEEIKPTLRWVPPGS